jgi:hypothetical protein
MNTLRGAEANALLKIDAALIDRLRLMVSQGANLDGLIQFLADRNVPKGGAIIALRRAEIADANDVKKAVHFHDAYGDRRKADEAFEERAFQTSQQFERSEADAA